MLPGKHLRGEVRVSRQGSERSKREGDGQERGKNEAMQLGQEISGKLPTKAQENWELARSGPLGRSQAQ